MNAKKNIAAISLAVLTYSSSNIFAYPITDQLILSGYLTDLKIHHQVKFPSAAVLSNRTIYETELTDRLSFGSFSAIAQLDYGVITSNVYHPSYLDRYATNVDSLNYRDLTILNGKCYKNELADRDYLPRNSMNIHNMQQFNHIINDNAKIESIYPINKIQQTPGLIVLIDTWKIGKGEITALNPIIAKKFKNQLTAMLSLPQAQQDKYELELSGFFENNKKFTFNDFNFKNHTTGSINKTSAEIEKEKLDIITLKKEIDFFKEVGNPIITDDSNQKTFKYLIDELQRSIEEATKSLYTDLLNEKYTDYVTENEPKISYARGIISDIISLVDTNQFSVPNKDAQSIFPFIKDANRITDSIYELDQKNKNDYDYLQSYDLKQSIKNTTRAQPYLVKSTEFSLLTFLNNLDYMVWVEQNNTEKTQKTALYPYLNQSQPFNDEANLTNAVRAFLEDNYNTLLTSLKNITDINSSINDDVVLKKFINGKIAAIEQKILSIEEKIKVLEADLVNTPDIVVSFAGTRTNTNNKLSISSLAEGLLNYDQKSDFNSITPDLLYGTINNLTNWQNIKLVGKASWDGELFNIGKIDAFYPDGINGSSTDSKLLASLTFKLAADKPKGDTFLRYEDSTYSNKINIENAINGAGNIYYEELPKNTWVTVYGIQRNCYGDFVAKYIYVHSVSPRNNDMSFSPLGANSINATASPFTINSTATNSKTITTASLVTENNVNDKGILDKIMKILKSIVN